MIRASSDGAREPASIYDFAIAGLASVAAGCTTLDEALRARLAETAVLRRGETFARAFARYLERPLESDYPLVALSLEFGLTPIEMLSVRLAAAVEDDVVAGHLISHLQQPLHESRPTIGLLAHAFGKDVPLASHALGQGVAVRAGILRLSADAVPLPERRVEVPLPTALALLGALVPWPGTSALEGEAALGLGATNEARARALGERLAAGGATGIVLVVRSGDAREARVAARRVCEAAHKTPLLVASGETTGLAPWLFLADRLPVFDLAPAPGERKSVPAIEAYEGPAIVLAGPDGDVEAGERLVLDWRIEIPAVQERAQLWYGALGDEALADRLAAEHRYSAAHIATLAARARAEAEAPLAYADVRRIARRGDALGIGTDGEVIADDVGDEALVVPAGLRDELETLVARCRGRERFADSLGPSIRARYRPAVRALFVGPSGTGKTLAAAWLATRLGMPLCRVDLAAVTSKYVGETEKNLARLFERAEESEVVLLFDEADALFGKRTDIHDANDRFANAQTNYLLQRLESYAGITVLTSNGRGRFDAAFTRRFDAILTFPAPAPELRRALWTTHLGDAHDATDEQLERLSRGADLCGGQIRNAVLRAAVGAERERRRIAFADVLGGVAVEYRKLGRPLPDDLRLAEGV